MWVRRRAGRRRLVRIGQWRGKRMAGAGGRQVGQGGRAGWMRATNAGTRLSWRACTQERWQVMCVVPRTMRRTQAGMRRKARGGAGGGRQRRRATRRVRRLRPEAWALLRLPARATNGPSSDSNVAGRGKRVRGKGGRRRRDAGARGRGKREQARHKTARAMSAREREAATHAAACRVPSVRLVLPAPSSVHLVVAPCAARCPLPAARCPLPAARCQVAPAPAVALP